MTRLPSCPNNQYEPSRHHGYIDGRSLPKPVVTLEERIKELERHRRQWRNTFFHLAELVRNGRLEEALEFANSPRDEAASPKP